MVTAEGEALGEHQGLMYYTSASARAWASAGAATAAASPGTSPARISARNTLVVVQGHDHERLLQRAPARPPTRAGSPARRPRTAPYGAKTRYRQADAACELRPDGAAAFALDFADAAVGGDARAVGRALPRRGMPRRRRDRLRPQRRRAGRGERRPRLEALGPAPQARDAARASPPRAGGTPRRSSAQPAAMSASAGRAAVQPLASVRATPRAPRCRRSTLARWRAVHRRGPGARLRACARARSRRAASQMPSASDSSRRARARARGRRPGSARRRRACPAYSVITLESKRSRRRRPAPAPAPW